MVVGSGALFGTAGTWLSGASETRLAKAILGTEMIETERRTTINRKRCTANFENILTGAYPGHGFYRTTLSGCRAHFFGDRRSAQISFVLRLQFNPSHLTS
jgi:hypothetical protein